MDYNKKISNILKMLRDKEIYPKLTSIDGSSTDTNIMIKNQKVKLFCSYNYLGIANDPRINNAIIESIEKYKIQPGGSRVVSGTQDAHLKLEEKIAKLKHTEKAILFTNGTMANMGTISAIMKIPDYSVEYNIKKYFLKDKRYVLSDALNHASIVDGCRLSGSNIIVYKHKDLKDLEDKLKSIKNSWKLIVTDGVFSMDGDIAPLPQIIELAKKYDALLMVDDAHSTGVLGKNGGGTLEHFGLTEGVDINMGTLSKAVAVMGGFIAGNADLIDLLRVTTRTYIFSGALPAPLAIGACKALEIMENASDLRVKLWENSDYLRETLKNKGYNTLLSESPIPIIPILIGNEKKASEFSNELLENGIFTPAIRWPAVEKNKARIRIALMASHTREDIDYLIKIIDKLNNKYNITNLK